MEDVQHENNSLNTTCLASSIYKPPKGTNDLRAEQERVGGLVYRVAQRATETFPSAKIIVSTILPRKDFHPTTIQRVNADVSRGCALPNVHLAHHSTITPHHFYDHVHLNRHIVKEFTKTLKNVALGRQTHMTIKQRGEHQQQRGPTTTTHPPEAHQYANCSKDQSQDYASTTCLNHFRVPHEPDLHNTPHNPEQHFITQQGHQHI
ncbi:hypothetical protein MHYP_G00086990 [Metynnis hypsauchen]